MPETDYLLLEAIIKQRVLFLSSCHFAPEACLLILMYTNHLCVSLGSSHLIIRQAKAMDDQTERKSGLTV